MLILNSTLFAISGFLYLAYFLVDLKKISDPKEFIALLFGTALIGVILSIEGLFLGIARIENKKKRAGILGIVFSSIALVSFIAYLTMRFVIRAHERGITLF